jgi:hypothetical protein
MSDLGQKKLAKKAEKSEKRKKTELGDFENSSEMEVCLYFIENLFQYTVGEVFECFSELSYLYEFSCQVGVDIIGGGVGRCSGDR